jgi:DNA-directed RNA polymerase subunit RPC12/RpoP
MAKKSKIACERCGFIGYPKVRRDGLGNTFYECPDCGAGEKDLIWLSNKDGKLVKVA